MVEFNQQAGQRLQHRLGLGPMLARGGLDAQSRQIGRAKGIHMEKPVQIAAPYPRTALRVAKPPTKGLLLAVCHDHANCGVRPGQ